MKKYNIVEILKGITKSRKIAKKDDQKGFEMFEQLLADYDRATYSLASALYPYHVTIRKLSKELLKSKNKMFEIIEDIYSSVKLPTDVLTEEQSFSAFRTEMDRLRGEHGDVVIAIASEIMEKAMKEFKEVYDELEKEQENASE